MSASAKFEPLPIARAAAAEVVPLVDRLERRGGRRLKSVAPPPLSRELDPSERARLVGDAEAEGRAQAQAKVEAVLERYLDGIRRLERAVQERARPDARDVVQLALVVARELIGRELKADPTLIEAAVVRALAEARGARPLKVRLAPDDLAYLHQRRPDLVSDGVELVGDPTLSIGSCVVEGEEQVVEATIEARLQAVRETLVSVLAGPDEDEADAA